MGNNVFANMREVSCKAADGKAICAFPDVCMTPPENPTTPPGVPIPYPNTGMASDTTSGSRSVKITGKEIMLKNKSYFSKSMGDEAGCASKKGVVTSVNRGKVYFNSWSMDVKVEGENVVRHLDLTTHNHGSVPGNTPTWPYIDTMNVNPQVMADCAGDMAKEQKACEDFLPYGDKNPCKALDFNGDLKHMTQDEGMEMAKSDVPDRKLSKTFESDTDPVNLTKAKKEKIKAAKKFSNKGDLSEEDNKKARDCLAARKCQLVPMKPNTYEAGCCPGQTPHHLVEAASFYDDSENRNSEEKSQVIGAAYKKETKNGKKKYAGYKESKAPCICVSGPNHGCGTHGIMHALQNEESQMKPKGTSVTMANGKEIQCETIKYSDARDAGIAAAKKTFPKSNCDDDCMKSQMDAYHNQTGVSDDTPIRSVSAGAQSPEAIAEKKKELAAILKGKSEAKKAFGKA